MAVFFACLTFVIGIGVWLDRVVAAKTRQKIAGIIKLPASRGFYDFLSESLNFIKPSLFDRLFSRDIFDGRFLVRSLLYSITICFIALTLHSLNGHQVLVPNRESTNIYGIVTLIAMFAITATIDYISAIQTGYFLTLATKTNRVWEILIIAFADVIVTINLFIFIFSAGIVMSAAIISMERLQVDINLDFQGETTPIQEVWDGYHTSRFDLYLLQKHHIDIFTKDAFRGTISVFARHGRVAGHLTTIATFSSPGIEPTDLAKITGELIARSPSLMNARQNASTDDVIVSGLKHSPLRLSDIPLLYSEAYKSVYRVQTEFWGVARGYLIATGIDDLYSAFYRITDQFRQRNGAASIYCLDTPTPALLSNVSTCKKWVAFNRDVNLIADAAVLTTHRPSTIPLSAFFISSFGVTVLVYLLVLCFVIGRLFYFSLRALAASSIINIDEYPFSYMAGPTGLIVGLLVASLWKTT